MALIKTMTDEKGDNNDERVIIMTTNCHTRKELGCECPAQPWRLCEGRCKTRAVRQWKWRQKTLMVVISVTLTNAGWLKQSTHTPCSFKSSHSVTIRHRFSLSRCAHRQQRSNHGNGATRGYHTSCRTAIATTRTRLAVKDGAAPMRHRSVWYL